MPSDYFLNIGWKSSAVMIIQHQLIAVHFIPYMCVVHLGILKFALDSASAHGTDVVVCAVTTDAEPVVPNGDPDDGTGADEGIKGDVADG